MNHPAAVRALPLPRVGAITSGPAESVPTLLFLPGWGASKELWWNTLRLLGTEYRCVAVDLPGTHGTPFDPARVTMRHLADWVAHVCTLLNAPRVTLVGHSLGGNMAAQTALDYPGLVSRLVLVGAALETDKLPRRALLALSPRLGRHALWLTRWASGPLAFLGRNVPHEHRGGNLLPMARRTHLFLQHNTDAVLSAHLSALHGNPLGKETLAQLTCPVLIMHGRGDAIIPVARARAMARSLPNAALAEFPRARHAPFDTDPALFADTLAGWLRLTEAP